MRSTSGHYFINLDHVRALAVLLVFVWHFNHFESGNIQPPLFFPTSILTEGHTGVSIFLTLSGYLFAKLLGNNAIDYKAFIMNRALRLFPLLFVVIIIGVVQAALNSNFGLALFKPILKGVLWPTLPNGGWSITVEMHFYILLPILLAVFLGKKIQWSILVLCVFLLVRYLEFKFGADVQFRSYYTILGRFDQFALGILAFRYSGKIPVRNSFGFTVALSFLCYFTIFDQLGGYYGPFRIGNLSWLWIFQLTIEGLAYAVLIAWYDKKSLPLNKITGGVAKIGQWSYSIYLLHCFVIFSIPGFLDSRLMDISNPYIKLVTATIVFALFLPIGYLSYTYIETPFLRYRRSYIK
jgi:peptidoglycan/LPS O-acetylase OafA/YrhL